MTWERPQVAPPEPVAAAPVPGLGRLLPALRWLASAQGAWPPREPREARTVAVAGGSFDAGVREADALADGGCDLLVLGSGADPVPGLVVVAALLGLEPVTVVGTATDAGWAARTVAVRDGLRAARGFLGDPEGLLAELGDGALGHLTGLLAQSAVRRTPVVLDGSALTAAAALLAVRLAPGSSAWWLAGQAPPSPAGARALSGLGLDPLLDLGLDRPEGAGLAADLLLRAVALAGEPSRA